MSEVLTHDELKERYCGEWVLIAYEKRDQGTNIIRGEVVAHSKERDEVYRALLTVKARKITIEYLGEIPNDIVFLPPFFLD